MIWILLVVGFFERKNRLEIKIHSLYACIINVEQVEKKEWSKHRCTYQDICSTSCTHLSNFFIADNNILMSLVQCWKDDSQVN